LCVWVAVRAGGGLVAGSGVGGIPWHGGRGGQEGGGEGVEGGFARGAVGAGGGDGGARRANGERYCSLFPKP